MGLVQPASAVLYDYYNPGEASGTLGRVGLGGSEGWQASPGGPWTGEAETGQCPNECPSLLFPEHKCSVFYGAPRKSKLLSTLCSADVCQCAEGETPDWGSGVEEAWLGPTRPHLGP